MRNIGAVARMWLFSGLLSITAFWTEAFSAQAKLTPNAVGPCRSVDRPS